MIMLKLLLIHLVADSFLQSREMAVKKSSEFLWLLQHLIINFTLFMTGLVRGYGWKAAFLFAFLNAAIHGLIDWNIWRGYKYSCHFRINADIDVEQAVRFLNGKAHLSDDERQVLYDSKVKAWKHWEDGWFFHTIMTDQFLHAATLVVLAEWLLK